MLAETRRDGDERQIFVAISEQLVENRIVVFESLMGILQ